jgi:hypothetical protein
MSEKTQQLLDKLKSITEKKQDKEPQSLYGQVPFSNFYDWDENGKELYRDRLYGDINGKSRLVNKDGTVYSGKIEKKRITVKGPDGNNFFSHVYETADGRWFDRGGLPIDKPNNLVKHTADNGELEASK